MNIMLCIKCLFYPNQMEIHNAMLRSMQVKSGISNRIQQMRDSNIPFQISSGSVSRPVLR